MSKKILMVDDTAIYRTQMQLFLSLYKFQVFLAVDGLDALKKMENETFDYIMNSQLFKDFINAIINTNSNIIKHEYTVQHII